MSLAKKHGAATSAPPSNGFSKPCAAVEAATRPARMTPRAQALAFRIWQYAEPLGWDCTVGEIADALGVGNRAISHMAEVKGWAIRLRGRTDGLDYIRGHQSPAVNETLLAGETERATVGRFARLAEEPTE
jgi:hypothetical protein